MEHYNPIFSKVPTLRFDFDGIWNKIHLYEITNKVSRKAPVNSTAPIRMISYGNGFILQSDKYSRDNAGESLKKYTLLKKGEMAYNHGASKNKKYGVCYSLKESDEARIPFVYHAFQINRGLPAFWNYALNISQIDKQLKKLVSSGARMDGLLNISYDDYMSISVYEPCVDEQAKISAFLSVIDKRIAVQNKIISKYETLIKGLCDMIFRHDKSASLSDLVKCKTSALQENMVSTCRRGEYKVLGASGAIAVIDTYQFDESGILVLKDGSKAGKIQFAQGKYSVIGTSVVLIPNEACDARYLYFAMSSIDFEKYKVGSGIPHIYFKDYSNERIYYPDKALRKKITKTLDFYETMVEIERKMLSAMQKQKAFLLQSMFI